MMGHRVGWIVLVMALMVLFLAACAGAEQEPAQKEPTEAAPATEAPAEEEAEPEPELEPEVEVEVTELVEEEVEVEKEVEAEPTEAPEPTETALPEEEPAEEEPAEEEEAQEESAQEAPVEEADDSAQIPASATPTLAPIASEKRKTRTPTPIPAPTTATPVPSTPAPILEERTVELEWPSWMRLGDSDLVRLSLIPAEEGVVVQAEFPEHEVESKEVVIESRPGYELFGVARLDSTTFDLSPSAEQEKRLTLGEDVTWRWTISPHHAGQQRLALQLTLRWMPQEGNSAQVDERMIYDKPLEIDVSSFLGLTTQQATASGLAGLALGSSLTLPLALYVLRPRRRSLFQPVAANTSLVIEENPAIKLSPQEESLLRALFHAYARLTLKAEFRSGYSGARIFLVLPVREGGRADAFTIAKLGESSDIEQEFYNYETFVKHTLPPITARILDQPITLSSLTNKGFLRSWKKQIDPFARRATSPTDQWAALRYTFIGEPGRMPTSLRQALLANPNPELLERLFLTFGPNWWMQRRPYTFQLAQEYDRMLPSHYMLEPAETAERALTNTNKAQSTLDGRQPPTAQSLQVGDLVTLRHLQVVERREDQGYFSLRGKAIPGHPPLRLRLYIQHNSQLRTISHLDGATVRVTATRETLLRDFVRDFKLYDLPDPLPRIPALFNEQLFGTQSPIHGDLNLENVLIGLGDFVWLIDFALTREGHPLYDFAHLEANLIAHVLAPRIPSPAAYLDMLRSKSNPLLTTLHDIAARCLFNPKEPREYQLALFATCIGALKYRNLNAEQKHLLYLTAAYVAESL